jgi:undecaprenyl-diphosphatase
MTEALTIANPAGERRREGAPSAPPVLEPRAHGPAAALARRLDGRHPAAVYLAALVAGYVLLVAVVIGVGLLLVHAILPAAGIGSADEHVNEVLARHRSANLNDATYVGSMIGDVPTIPALVTLAVLVAAVLRRWRVAAFVLGAILVEVSTYRLASLIVHRERPTVPRLDHLPVNQSYPSGHVAASVAVYAGLALLLASVTRRTALAAAGWTLAVVLVAIVAFSRMDRGMHHPIDAAAGALIGVASVCIAVLAARAAGAAAERRR